MARRGHIDWNLPETNEWDTVKTALLMDLRDELKKLNGWIGCANTMAIPHILREIAVNTKRETKRKRKRG